jgi:uncharacterized membrane protein YciS (DUF1049 family)
MTEERISEILGLATIFMLGFSMGWLYAVFKIEQTIKTIKKNKDA